MTNQQFFDIYTRHIIDTELYAEARAILAEDMLLRLNRDLQKIIVSYGIITSKAKQVECEKECNECIKKYILEWQEEEEKERDNFVTKEMNWLSTLIKVMFGISIISSLLKQKKILETPFSPTDTFSSFAENLERNIIRIVRTPLISSRIFGSSTSSVSENLDNSFPRIIRETKSNIITSVTALQRNVQYQLLEDKRKLSFKYISMLDEKVCTVCGGYSGDIYEDLSQAPAVPVHNRCRCYYLPILSSAENTDGNENYAEWFKRQPDNIKYRILGPTRYNFYKSGAISIKQFSSNGRKLTLTELFKSNIN